MSSKEFFQNVIALVYDFDGTLCPQPMQEYTVLPELGIESEDFWREVNAEAEATASEGMLVYMRFLLKKAEEAQVAIPRDKLGRLAEQIVYFPGVDGPPGENWFDRLNAFVAEVSGGQIALRHYIVSAGLKEILDGASIRGHFHNIFASEYHFDHNGVARFPKWLINETTKTQFLFRINKGREGLLEPINEFMPEAARPIPFANMIYIGDGVTDVPSMAVTRKNGGHAAAVYQAEKKRTRRGCRELLRDDRVDFIAEADYRAGSELDGLMRTLLGSVVAGIQLRRAVWECRLRHPPPKAEKG